MVEEEVSPNQQLVVFGTTGTRVMFTRDDLVMPDDIKLKAAKIPWYNKQWDAVSSFMMKRVVAESTLQVLNIEEVIRKIVEIVEKRWEKRVNARKAQQKKKKLLSGKTGAGKPSKCVLITNFTSLETFRDPQQKSDILADLINGIKVQLTSELHNFHDGDDDDNHQEDAHGPSDSAKEEVRRKQAQQTASSVAAAKVVDVEVMIDDDKTNDGNGDVGDQVVKKRKLEDGEDGEKSTTAKEENSKKNETEGDVLFDDRVAVVVTLDTIDSAVVAVSHLHGKSFDGRSIICRFFEK